MALTNFLTTDKALASVLNDKVVTPTNAHINSTINPHSVTKTQVGLANVTNDAQIPKTLLTTAGDTIYASSANTPARLPKGTARQQLAMNPGATAPEWVASLQSLITAPGDLIYGSAANTPAKLAKGTDGQVLTLASGLPSWATPSKTVTGTFAGNNTTNRLISLGFTPKMVILQWASGGYSFWSLSPNPSGGSGLRLALSGSTLFETGADSANYPVVTAGGFQVSYRGDYRGINDAGFTYYYTAIG